VESVLVPEIPCAIPAPARTPSDGDALVEMPYPHAAEDDVIVRVHAAGLIGGVFMIPTRDGESELLTNPRVEDVALVGYPDDDGGELPCAVLVPATVPPIALDELRLHLAGQGMTEWDLPTRLEYVESLPRNGKGKVRKELLRRWLVGRASLLD
jgi:hypothetical protein